MHPVKVIKELVTLVRRSDSKFDWEVTNFFNHLKSNGWTFEKCICAAVKTTNGIIIRGHRHHNCIDIIVEDLNKVPDIHRGQGFITSTGRFVNREEGYQLHKDNGIDSVAKGGYRGRRLFSEDLY